jgi:hypothetical protein
MLRATGFRKPIPMPWARRRHLGGPRDGFSGGPVRTAAKVTVVALVLLNAVLLYQLVGRDNPQIDRVAKHNPAQNPAAGSASKELREALQAAQAMIRAEVEGSTVARDKHQSDRVWPAETFTGGSGTPTSSASASTGSGGGTPGGSGGSDSDPPQEPPAGDGGGAVPGGGGGGGGGTGGGDPGGGDPGGGSSGGGGGGG